MIRNIWVFALAFLFSAAQIATAAPSRPELSAAEIVNKNVAARGGLQAWRLVQAMTLAGKLGVGGNQRADRQPTSLPGKKVDLMPTDARPAAEVQLPFVMEMKRPLKVRFELQFKGQTAVQVYDGTNGWKLRPYLNRHDVEPYTAEEMKKAAMQAELDGPLVDYAAKGTKVDLDGIDKVEDRDTYKLKLTLKGGQVIHVWVDERTFLEAKIEGLPRRLDGVDHQVEVYYRDYRTVNGLQIPFVLETRVLPATATGAAGANHARATPIPAEKITVERVTVNPKLDAALFVRPDLQAQKGSGKQLN